MEPTAEQASALEEAKAKFAAAEEAANAAEAAFHRAEEERSAAEERETELRGPLRKAEQSLTELDAEREALRRVLAANESEDWTPLIEMIEVDAGYENALAAALGDDLGAAVDEDAPAHWSHLGETAAEISLPDGVSPLSRFVRAPAPLNRRLAAIGVITRDMGADLRGQLKPGQRLVTTHADAKTSAAIRLEQRNRLQVLDNDFAAAEAAADAARRDHAEAAETLKSKQANEREVRSLFNDARRALDSARTGLNELEREYERAVARLSSIDEHLARLSEEKAEGERTQEAHRP